MMVCSAWIDSFDLVPPLGARLLPKLPAGFGSVARSMPLGLMFGRPGPPFSRAISSRPADASSDRHYANELGFIENTLALKFKDLGLQPSAAWRSGGGVQGLFKLDQIIGNDQA